MKRTLRSSNKIRKPLGVLQQLLHLVPRKCKCYHLALRRPYLRWIGLRIGVRDLLGSDLTLVGGGDLLRPCSVSLASRRPLLASVSWRRSDILCGSRRSSRPAELEVLKSDLTLIGFAAAVFPDEDFPAEDFPDLS